MDILTSPIYVYKKAINEETPLLAKFTNFLTKKGQKAKAGRIIKKVLKVLQNLQPLAKIDPLMVIQKALHHVKPSFELRKARIGGSTQLIPAALPLHKQENRAIRTLILNASIKQKKNSNTQKHNDMYSFAYFLAIEIYEAHKNEGTSCQMKNTVHKQAENNRNFIRRRWW